MSQLLIAKDIEKTWLQGVWMPLTMRQVPSRNFPVGCTQLDTPTITTTSDVLDSLGYEGPLGSNLVEGKSHRKITKARDGKVPI